VAWEPGRLERDGLVRIAWPIRKAADLFQTLVEPLCSCTPTRPPAHADTAACARAAGDVDN
jgi:hypothetical protein